MGKAGKVAILSNTRGGVYTFTTSLARKLEAEHPVCLYFLSKPPGGCAGPDGLETRYLTTGPVPNPLTIAKILLGEMDVMHINFASFGPLAMLRRMLYGTPYVLTLHGLPQVALESSYREKIKYTIEGMLLKYAAERASATVTISNYVREEIKSRYGVDAIVIHHGVDPGAIRRAVDKRSAMRLLGFDEGEFILLSVEKLHPYKDPMTLLRAFQKANLGEKARLVMIGRGELQDEAQRFVEENGLGARVSLITEVVGDGELSLYYDAADAFALTSINEGFGIVLLEAMAHGLPILASGSGACPEVAGEAGLYFRVGDPDDLAGKMAQLRDADLRAKLGERGLTRVKSNFSLDDKMGAYIGLFDAVIKRRNQ